MILYTKNICPKCMLIKRQIKEAGLTEKFKFINMDHDNEAKQKVINAGFLTAPVLEINNNLIGDVLTMENIIERLSLNNT